MFDRGQMKCYRKEWRIKEDWKEEGKFQERG